MATSPSRLRIICTIVAILIPVILLTFAWKQYLASALLLFLLFGYLTKQLHMTKDSLGAKTIITAMMILLVTSLYTSCIRSDTPQEKAAKQAQKLALDPNWNQLLEQIKTQELFIKNNTQLSKIELENENLKLDHLNTQKEFYELQGELNPSHGYVKVAAETTLKKIMNDPSSLKDLSCSPAKAAGKSWEVDCTYRGKNAYGGVVSNTGTFLIFKNYLAVPVD